MFFPTDYLLFPQTSLMRVWHLIATSFQPRGRAAFSGAKCAHSLVTLRRSTTEEQLQGICHVRLHIYAVGITATLNSANGYKMPNTLWGHSLLDWLLRHCNARRRQLLVTQAHHVQGCCFIALRLRFFIHFQSTKRKRTFRKWIIKEFSLKKLFTGLIKFSDEFAVCPVMK